MTAKKGPRSSGFRLALVLAGLGAANLANYGTQNDAECNCSAYQGQMEMDPAYLVLAEGETGRVRASFPKRAQWSIERPPPSEVIAQVSALIQNQEREFLLELTAADRITPATTFLDPWPVPISGTFGFEETEPVFRGEAPADRTHVEITARPGDSDSGSETRRLTVFVLTPVLFFSQELRNFVDRNAEELDLDTVVLVDPSLDEWNFEFDLSDAPSFRAPSVRQVGPIANAVRADFPYADTMQWQFILEFRGGSPDATVDDRFICRVEEPVHITASSGDRILRRTVLLRVWGKVMGEAPDRFCPQPADFRE